MMHEFLSNNRDDLIERCRIKVAHRAARDVVQKVPLPGYTENRRSRARKGIRCFEWNLDLNHASSWQKWNRI
jgi:hypothetical protein